MISYCLKEILHVNAYSKGNERGNKNKDKYIFTCLRCWCWEIRTFFNAELNIPFLPTPFRFFLVSLAQFHIFKTKICFYSYSLYTSKDVNYAFFQVTKKIVYKKTGKWYIEWTRVTTSGRASGSKWQQVMQIVNEWQRVTANDNEWQRLTVSGTANENEREQVK